MGQWDDFEDLILLRPLAPGLGVVQESGLWAVLQSEQR